MSSDSDTARACSQKMHRRDQAAQALGLRIEGIAPGSARVVMEVTANMINGFDVCHGGFLFLLADTAFAHACNTYDNVSYAAGAQIEYLEPVRLGDVLTAHASELGRRGRSGVYDVRIVNQHGTTVALFRGRSHATNRPILAAETDPE